MTTVTGLELLDADLTQRTLAAPPFHAVDGVINFRDFGFGATRTSIPLPLPRPHSHSPSGPGILFRSGELTRLTPRGKEQLKELGITTLFDLRSTSEVDKFKTASPEIEGVRNVHVPVHDGNDFDPMVLAAKVAKFEADEKNSFATLYSGILEDGAHAYEVILKHLRDKPGEPCLVHCTAGKDRTGVFAALVLLLLGASDEAIAQDYYFTTVGLQKVLPMLVARYQEDPVYRNNWKGFLNMGSAKKETMLATLAMIREKYGGAETYVKQYTSLTNEDIVQIRKNLLVARA
ncbi:protein-tyrosine phosphatase-like protein [Phellopilus nigrolimitatus]|nr:protein-tyrosine phosphatase-like protein [Phellopilus nigrolimitatus]